LTANRRLPQTNLLNVSGKSFPPAPPAKCLFALALACLCPLASPVEAVEQVRLPIFDSVVESFATASGSKELLFRLPEHVSIESGTELALVLRASPDMPADLFSVTVSFNGHKLSTRATAAASKPGASAERVELNLNVPATALFAGFNRITIAFVPGPMVPPDSVQSGRWSLRQNECALRLAFSRLPAFPELARFPATFVEEKLLRPISSESDSLVSIVLPSQVRDIHLRGCVILAGRFGQLGYVSDHDYTIVRPNLSAWVVPDQNWIVVGRWDEIQACTPATQCVGAKIPKAGEGLLAECVTGTGVVQRRGLVVTGGDDAGVEKALLALGSSEVLSSIGPSPVTVPNLVEISSRSREKVNRSFGGAAKVENLNQARALLTPDPLLERLAFVVPLDASPAELRTCFGLAAYAGQMLQQSPALWPDACGYDGQRPASLARVHGKTTVLLGSAKQWLSALPSGATLPIQISAPFDPDVYMQGRKYAISQFDPSLTFLQLVSSPWSKNDVTLVAGGWETLAAPRTKWMITDPQASEKVYGNVSAADKEGRVASFKTRLPSTDSLAERIKTFIPRDVSVEETNHRLRSIDQQVTRSHEINTMVFYACGGVLIGLVALRLLLSWQRTRRRDKALQSEAALGAHP
jgi:hypothetical protein